jgi:NAD-dependent SIR2 family protein deacetylase
MLDNLIKCLRKARSTLIITGAGISTASGIPDYRSPADTKIAIGAGQYNRDTPLQFKPVTYAAPSFSHLAISQLARNNIVSSVLTQNVDNLHSKALLPSRSLI